MAVKAILGEDFDPFLPYPYTEDDVETAVLLRDVLFEKPRKDKMALLKRAMSRNN